MTCFNPHSPNMLPWPEALKQMRHGDLAQFRSTSTFGSLITFGTFAIHSHTATLTMDMPEPGILDTTAKRGCSERPLRMEVEAYPGRIDLFHPDRLSYPEYDPAEMVEKMRTFIGRSYGRRGLIRLALMRSIFVRWWWFFFPPDFSDEDQEEIPFCSHLRALCDRVGGGVDPVPNYPDHLVSPGMLTMSLLYGTGYYGTLA